MLKWIIVLLIAPGLAFLSGLFRAIVLFWPTMVFIGALHSNWPAIPALGWAATFFLIAVIGLLIPTGSSVDLDD